MATSSNRRAVVFDLDGTLVEVSARDYAVYRDVLVDDRLAPLPCSEYWPLRRARTQLAAILAHSTEAPDTYMESFVERRESRYEAPEYLDLDTVLPTVHETLSVIQEQYHCVLITSRRDALATAHQLAKLQLRRYFQSVCCCNGHKGEALAVVTDVALIIGDTEHDIGLALGHGHRCVAVTTGMRSREFLEAYEPDYIADRLGEVLGLL